MVLPVPGSMISAEKDISSFASAEESTM